MKVSSELLYSCYEDKREFRPVHIPISILLHWQYDVPGDFRVDRDEVKSLKTGVRGLCRFISKSAMDKRFTEVLSIEHDLSRTVN